MMEQKRTKIHVLAAAALMAVPLACGRDKEPETPEQPMTPASEPVPPPTPDMQPSQEMQQEMPPSEAPGTGTPSTDPLQEPTEEYQAPEEDPGASEIEPSGSAPQGTIAPHRGKLPAAGSRR